MKYDDIEMAFDYVSSNQPFINSAYISRMTGEIYYTSELGDSDELPDDIDDTDIYLSIPHKNDLDLGRELVLNFTAEFLSDDLDEVSDMFRRKGAYSRFKNFLEIRGKLETWYSYENEKQKETLLNWCKENDLEIDDL